MNPTSLKLRVWTWIQTHVDPGTEFRTVQLRKGLRLTSDRSRSQLSYVLFLLVKKEKLLERVGRRAQAFRLAPSAVVIEPVVVPDPPPFMQLLAFIIGYLKQDHLQFVRASDLLSAIASNFGGDVRLLQRKTDWHQSYCWAMHRLKRRGWVLDWGTASITVSPALHVDWNQVYNRAGQNDLASMALDLERWWKAYEAIQLKPSQGPNLLSSIAQQL